MLFQFDLRSIAGKADDQILQFSRTVE